MNGYCKHDPPLVACAVCRLADSDPRARRLFGLDGDPPRRLALPTAGGAKPSQPRPGRRCLHLGRRTEFRPGCGGWQCGHDCGAGKGTVRPGGECQTCDRFTDDGAF